MKDLLLESMREESLKGLNFSCAEKKVMKGKKRE